MATSQDLSMGDIFITVKLSLFKLGLVISGCCKVLTHSKWPIIFVARVTNVYALEGL